MQKSINQWLALINFALLYLLLPATYGLATYGEFIGLNAAAFLIHRIFIISSTPLTRTAHPGTTIYNALVLAAMILVLSLLARAVLPIGSPLLLLTLLVQASALLALQSMQRHRLESAMHILTSAAFIGLLGWSRNDGYAMPLDQLVEFAIGIPAFLGLATVLVYSEGKPHRHELKASLLTVRKHAPSLLSMTAMANLLANGLPIFLARTLVPYELGIFRVMVALIEVITSLVTLDLRAILTKFATHPRSRDLYALLKNAALCYYVALACGIILLALLVPDLRPFTPLLAALPIYGYTILAEHRLITVHRKATRIVVNLLMLALMVCALPSAITIERAVTIYTGGLVMYAALLALTERRLKTQIADFVLLAACPFAATAMVRDLRAGLFYLALLLAVELMQRCPTRGGIRMLGKAIR